MAFIRAVAIAAALVAFAAPHALATGSRIDRHDRHEKAEEAAAEKVWHYAKGAEMVGPLSTAELIAAAKAGEIKADTQVHHPDAGWRAASAVPELAGLVS